jgi:hypothetical protein
MSLVLERATERELRLSVADEVFAPGYVFHDPLLDEPVRGPDGFKRLIAMYLAAAPDVRILRVTRGSGNGGPVGQVRPNKDDSGVDRGRLHPHGDRFAVGFQFR